MVPSSISLHLSLSLILLLQSEYGMVPSYISLHQSLSRILLSPLNKGVDVLHTTVITRTMQLCILNCEKNLSTIKKR